MEGSQARWKVENFFILLEVLDKEMHRDLAFAREGRYSVAMIVLGSKGCVSSDDIKALDDLVCHHHQHEFPQLIDKHMHHLFFTLLLL